MLEPGQFVALVETSAMRAAGEEGGCFVLELKRAEVALEDVAEGSALASLAAPFAEEPGGEDRAQHDDQVDQDEIAETDRDHGMGASLAAMAASS
jgi:hypothetical protein